MSVSPQQDLDPMSEYILIKVLTKSVSRSYIVYKKLIYVASAGSSQLTESILGIDLPFIVPLPRDVTSSCHMARWSATTQHLLRVTVSHGSKEIVKADFPLVVKRYDTLPLYRQFNQPITRTEDSADRQVMCEYSIPNLSVGPRDDLIVYVKVASHPGKRKAKLKRIGLELRERVCCHEGGLGNKDTKIVTFAQDFDNVPITTQGIASQLSLTFPVENDVLASIMSSQDKSPRECVASTEYTHTEIPLTHAKGFSLEGKLYSIQYELVLRIKLSHARDIETRQPITVCPFDRISSGGFLKWIMKEWEITRKEFGEASNEELSKLVDQQTLPTKLYRLKNKSDWSVLGLSDRAVGSTGKSLAFFVD